MEWLERCREVSASRRGRRLGVLAVGLGVVVTLVHLIINQVPHGQIAGNASHPPLDRPGRGGHEHSGSPTGDGNGLPKPDDRARRRVSRFLEGGEDVKTFADYLVAEDSLTAAELLAEHQNEKWSEISSLISELTGREGTNARDAIHLIVQTIKGLPARLDLVEDAFQAGARSDGYLFVVATGRVDDPEGLWTNLERFPVGIARERAARGYLNAALKSADNVPLALARVASVDTPDLREICLGNLRSGVLALVEEGKLERQALRDLIGGATLTAREKEYLNP